MSSKPTPVPPQMKDVNKLNANGYIDYNNSFTDDEGKNHYTETGDQPSHLPDISTSCNEDKKIDEYFAGQVGQKARYTFFGNKSNCRWYAFYVYSYVIKNIITPSRK